MSEVIKVIMYSGDIIGIPAIAVFVLVWAAGNGAQNLADAIKYVTLALFTFCLLSTVAAGFAMLGEIPQRSYDKVNVMIERDQRLTTSAKEFLADGSISGWEYVKLQSEHSRHDVAKGSLLAALGMPRSTDSQKDAAKKTKKKQAAEAPAVDSKKQP